MSVYFGLSEDSINSRKLLDNRTDIPMLLDNLLLEQWLPESRI